MNTRTFRNTVRSLALRALLVVAFALAATGCAGNIGPSIDRGITAQISRSQRLRLQGDTVNATLALDGLQAQIRLACELGVDACRNACAHANEISNELAQWDVWRRQRDAIGLAWDRDVAMTCQIAGTSEANIYPLGSE